jgi:hypothetical protein
MTGQRHTCALVAHDTGEIYCFAHPPNPDEYVEGEFVGEYIVRWGDPFPGVDPKANNWQCKDWYWDNANGEWVKKPDYPGLGYSWNVDTKAWDLNSAFLYVQIRSDRDHRLFISDWTQMPDSPLTSTKKAEWVTYRQALRDFPLNNSNITNYSSIVWPTTPDSE